LLSIHSSTPECLQPAIHAHPGFTLLFPLFGAAALASLLPLLLYLSFRAEFAALHPAYPPHYVFLVRRLLRALSGSKQLKVGGRYSAGQEEGGGVGGAGG
jgi:hypothetical protein